MTSPSDGRITSLQNLSALSGQELFIVVSPPNPANGINYNVSASTLVSAVAAQVVTSFSPTTANFFFAGATTGAGTSSPTFRAQVLADLPMGTSGLPLVAQGTTTADAFQVLTLAGGGLGTNTVGTGALLVGQGTAVGTVSGTTAGLALVSQGSTSPPTYTTLGSTGISSGAIGGTQIANGAVGSTQIATSGVQNFNLTHSTITISTSYALGSTYVPTYKFLKSGASFSTKWNSTTSLMAGLGTSPANFTFSPAITGDMAITVNLVIEGSTTNSSPSGILVIGTGNAPASGAAATGTIIDGSPNFTTSIYAFPSGDNSNSFSQTVLVTGLTVGSTYWLDYVRSNDVANQTTTIFSPSVIIIELL